MKWILLIVLFVSTSLMAETSKLKFIDELLSESDYFRVLTVLKEQEFNNRGTKDGLVFQKKIISLHFRSEDFESLDQNVNKLITNYSEWIKEDPKELKAEVRFFLKNYDVAFAEIINSQGSLEKKYLFRSYTSSQWELPKCDSQQCKEIVSIEHKIKHEQPKSLTLASALGIVPGLGQVYAGNFASGITTFILTGFFTATTIVAFNNNEDAFALASGTVGSIFYLSSIYAGYETARLKNESFVKGQHKKLKDLNISFKLIELSFE